MCGIMVTNIGKYDGSMKHRGIRTNRINRVGLDLIHEHLPIQAYKDPIIEENNFIVLFNGELFVGRNDIEYLRDLFRSVKSVNEAIDTIKNVDGFYSFIIIDRMNKSIVAFTDPLGKKQLYYSKLGISSEIRPHHKLKLTRDFIHSNTIVKFGYSIDDRTPFNEIKRLMPNCVYTFNYSFNIISLVHDYYTFKPCYNANTYDVIDEAVKNRLAGHEGIGMLLSGGLDSSIIYHHANKYIDNLKTYCVSNSDDIKYASMIDKNVESILLEYDKNALKSMEMAVDLGSMYQQYSLFKSVNETVILTGDGADEAFGGYRRMNQYDSQYSDIFNELPFYHNVRLDRMSMAFTKEARSPFMSISVIEAALGLKYEDRINKKHLRDSYRSILPDEIVNRAKEPLKNDLIRQSTDNPSLYRQSLVKEFYDTI